MKKQLLLVVLCCAHVSIAQELITSFDSVLDVQKDGSVHVTETITVNAEGRTIKHGITRDFPTHYKDRRGHNYIVHFHVNEVLMNSKPVAYHVKDFANGKRIYIGKADRILSPGTYTFTINYTVNRVLGFFDTHDELYWNVTGNKRMFEIEKAQATVHLPSGLSKDQIHVEAYTGYFGQKGANYTAEVDNQGVAHFSTTEPLNPQQGLTIVTTWPKGYVTSPTALQKFIYLLTDNKAITLFLVALLAFLGYFVGLIIHVQKNKPPVGTIIPLFEPPQNLSPAEVRFVSIKGYDNICFAAQVVWYAVKGLLTIEYKKKFWQDHYSLKKIKNAPFPLFNRLFEKNDTIALARSNRQVLEPANRLLTKHLEAHNRYFTTHTDIYSIAIILGIIQLITSIFAGFLFIGVVAILIVFLFSKLITTYTHEGQIVKDQIDGFKMFLKTTEADRIEMIGTPPTKTPELYEQFLPYAIALEVEKQWTKQFAPLFKHLESQGRPYQPIWIIGRPFSPNFAPAFARDLSTSISSAISSATTTPGSSSGSGGRGSSGGGAGGGGVGGW